MTIQDILLLIFAAAEGGLTGSFIGLMEARIPALFLKADDHAVSARDLLKTVCFPASHCEACNRYVHLRDMMPVLSYIALRGRCRDCGALIGGKYFLLELAGAVAGGLSISLLGASIEGLLCFLALALLIGSAALARGFRSLAPTGVPQDASPRGVVVRSSAGLQRRHHWEETPNL